MISFMRCPGSGEHDRDALGAAERFEALRRRCRAYVAFGTAQPHLYRVMFGAWWAVCRSNTRPRG